jgi:UDP-2,3-diacylglucosamine hydrolase
MTPPQLHCRLWLRLPVLWLLSDLHLDPITPSARQQQFVRWLQQLPPEEPIAILGDFFDYWIGDDWDPPAFADLFTQLAAVAKRRLILFQPGNRDFLVGRHLAKRLGFRRLPDLVGVDTGTARYLLTHGDALCWDDAPYLAWRAQARDPAWQRAFLARPLAERLAFAQQARQQSAMRHDIPDDLSETAVAALFQRYPGTHLIHGHTHIPRDVPYPDSVTGALRYRWVLAEWRDHQPAPLARLDAAGFHRMVSA